MTSLPENVLPDKKNEKMPVDRLCYYVQKPVATELAVALVASYVFAEQLGRMNAQHSDFIDKYHI